MHLRDTPSTDIYRYLQYGYVWIPIRGCTVYGYTHLGVYLLYPFLCSFTVFSRMVSDVHRNHPKSQVISWEIHALGATTQPTLEPFEVLSALSALNACFAFKHLNWCCTSSYILTFKITCPSFLGLIDGRSSRCFNHILSTISGISAI